MLYHYLVPLAGHHIVFNLFRYLAFRAAGGMATALVLSFLLGPPIIRGLRALHVGQVVRKNGPAHAGKAGTPTMGGVLILAATAVSTILWADLSNRFVLITLAVFLGMGLLGFLDDYLKVVSHRTEGLVARYKLLGQGAIGIMVGVLLLVRPISPIPQTWTMVPFFAEYHMVIWAPLFVPWVIVVLAGSSNAVNLTDGLDGLAAGLTSIAAATFAVFAYLIGRSDTSQYLRFFYLPGAGELAIFCVALAGAALGFLWYNAHPAEVFMGDTGSLALGGAIGAAAVLLKLEFLLVIVGGVFVAEAVSVLTQVGYYKYTFRRYGAGRRIFRMAPLHHHFEQLGWPESKVIIRFWILGVLCALFAFSTLKIR
ncbi:MAG: phospho-N-acetylmuramoyl-pentapeptide-transferase [Gemmatimonadota bacterium]